MIFTYRYFLFWFKLDPAHWKYLFSTCGGEQQSPINIKTSKVKTNRRLGQFDFSELTTERNVKINIQNNGHTGMYYI